RREVPSPRDHPAARRAHAHAAPGKGVKRPGLGPLFSAPTFVSPVPTGAGRLLGGPSGRLFFDSSGRGLFSRLAPGLLGWRFRGFARARSTGRSHLGLATQGERADLLQLATRAVGFAFDASVIGEVFDQIQELGTPVLGDSALKYRPEGGD